MTMRIDVPDHHTVNVGIMMASIGYYMIKESGKVPTELHQLAGVFNQITADEYGKEGDFFETIAQKFPDVADTIRNDVMVKKTTSYQGW